MRLQKKFRAFVSGYGGGKTWVGCTAMGARFWQSPKINQGYFAPTYPQIRDIFFPTIEEVAHGLGLRTDIKEANKEVHFYSGRQYRGTTICRSLERPQSVVGFKIGHALVDEFDVLDPERANHAWKKIIARLRWDGATNGVDVTTTPEGFRATHKIFVADISANPVLSRIYGIVQASTRDNAANLPTGYIESLAASYPEQLIAAYIDGQFCNLTTGTVYRCYNRERHASIETIQSSEPLFIGMDFNIGRMAATIYVKRPNGWHAVAELKDLFDTAKMIESIKSRWASNRIVVYPDASGAAGHSSSATSDHVMLRQAGFDLRARPTNPPVRDRINSVNKQFELGALWVNAKACPTTAKNLEQQAYDSNGEPDKKGGFDHQNDATGYPIAFEFPLTFKRAITAVPLPTHMPLSRRN